MKVKEKVFAVFQIVLLAFCLRKYVSSTNIKFKTSFVLSSYSSLLILQLKKKTRSFLSTRLKRSHKVCFTSEIKILCLLNLEHEE